MRGVARIGGGTAHVFYAPMIVDDAQTATAIRRQADVADALALVPSGTITMLAIGAWAPGLSTVYDACSPGERDAIARLGVCEEMTGVASVPAETSLANAYRNCSGVERGLVHVGL